MRKKTLEQEIEDNKDDDTLPDITGGVGGEQFDVCKNKNCVSNKRGFLAKEWMTTEHEGVICTLCGTTQCQGVWADQLPTEFRSPIPEILEERSKPMSCRSTATPMEEIKSAKPSLGSQSRWYEKALFKADRMTKTETDIMETTIADARELLQKGLLAALGRDKERIITNLLCLAEQTSHAVYSACRKRRPKWSDRFLAMNVFLASLLKADTDNLLRRQHFSKWFFPREGPDYTKAEELLQEIDQNDDEFEDDV